MYIQSHVQCVCMIWGFVSQYIFIERWVMDWKGKACFLQALYPLVFKRSITDHKHYWYCYIPVPPATSACNNKNNNKKCCQITIKFQNQDQTVCCNSTKLKCRAFSNLPNYDASGNISMWIFWALKNLVFLSFYFLKSGLVSLELRMKSIKQGEPCPQRRHTS